MQIGTIGPCGKGMKCSTLRIRMSKIKGQDQMSRFGGITLDPLESSSVSGFAAAVNNVGRN